MKHSPLSYGTAAVAVLAIASGARAEEFYSFDGVGFPTCYNVTTVHNATSVDESESFASSSSSILPVSSVVFNTFSVLFLLFS